MLKEKRLILKSQKSKREKISLFFIRDNEKKSGEKKNKKKEMTTRTIQHRSNSNIAENMPRSLEA